MEKDEDFRLPILRRALLDGSAWEPTTAAVLERMDRICAAATPKSKFKQKRLGAKRGKSLERLQSRGEVLNAEEATLYRALAARANYLALDRPDIGFATKELCRDFSQPNRLSIQKLRRLIRYLVHNPRLVYLYPFQDSTAELSTFVDTDFAGCMKTRRSTSGGVSSGVYIFCSIGARRNRR